MTAHDRRIPEFADAGRRKHTNEIKMQASRQLLARSLFCFRTEGTARLISTTPALNMPLKAGDKLPSVDLYENNPGNKVNTSDLKGKVIIFGVPGAFTPTCNNDHAPAFIKNADDLKKKGVSSIVCVSVNDPFVMESWGNALGAAGKVRFLADTTGEFVKKADLDIDLSAVLGNVRSKRFAMVVENGVVKGINVEPDGTGLTCSKPADVTQFL
ncbi:peroxiredoxin-5, mitochondrial-like [Babylonia areolata]|uniref:peroxiredoxin-5, mitochondrial-like n=1 Tax=Babylonia areolata TaxID=304850 RepID=UPI003FD1DA65